MAYNLGWQRIYHGDPFVRATIWVDELWRVGNRVHFTLNASLAVEKVNGFWDFPWFVDWFWRENAAVSIARLVAIGACGSTESGEYFAVGDSVENGFVWLNACGGCVTCCGSCFANIVIRAGVDRGVIRWFVGVAAKRFEEMIAYSSVSHMGVVVIGIATLHVWGMTGAVYQMVAHGLVAGATFMLIGLLYERTHTRDINDYGSLIKVTPRFAVLIILAFAGGVGLPATAGFVAELHVLLAGFTRWQWWIVLLSLGVLITATYSIRTIKHLYTGQMNPRMQQVSDLGWVEVCAAGSLIVATLWLGLQPNVLLEKMDVSIHSFAQRIQAGGTP